MVTFTIWGSCVSREIFNYTDPLLKVQRYLLQNPMHTLWHEGIEVQGEITAGTDFLKRMFKLELNKKAKEYFAESKSDYLIIDTCDCRLGWYEIEKQPNIVRICASPTCENNLKLISQREKLKKHFAIEIIPEEWYAYAEKFAKFILEFYPIDRIILNKFEFSRGGYDNELKEWRKYEGFGNIEELNRLTEMVAKYLEEIFNHKCLVIDEYVNPEGNWKSYLGASPLHYTDEVYKTQARKLENLVGLT